MSCLRVKRYVPVYEEPVDTCRVLDSLGNVVETSISDPNDGLNVEDFSIKSLIDAGAADLLANRVSLSRSLTSVADDVQQIDANLGDFDVNQPIENN